MKFGSGKLAVSSLGVLAIGAVMSFGAPANASSCGSEYAVAPGDTLSKIAQKCSIDIVDLVRANAELSNPNRLSIGQKLAMPETSAVLDEEVETMAAVDPKPAAGPRTISGLVVSGARCALLETEDGALYGLTGSNKVYPSGQTVTVTGTMHGTDECGPQQMLVVSDLVNS